MMRFLYFFLTGILICHITLGQEIIEKDTVLPIKLSNIPERSIETNEFINILNSKINDPVFSSSLEEGKRIINSTQKLIDQYQNQNISPSESHLRELNILLNDYQIAKNDLSEILTQVQGKVENLESNLQKINNEEDQWSEAQGNLTEEDQQGFTAIEEITQNILEQINSTKKQLISKINESLIIEEKLIFTFQQVESIVSGIENRIIERKKNIFMVDSPPIWKLEPFTVEEIQSQLVSDIKKYLRSLANILSKDLKNTFTFIIFLVILLAGMFYVKNYVHSIHEELNNKNIDDEKVRELRQYNIFNRPISISLIFCLTFVLNDEMLPIEIHEVAGLALVLPLILVLKKHLSKIIYSYIIIVFAVFIFQKVCEISFYSYSFLRITNLICSVTLFFLVLELKTRILKKWRENHRLFLKRTIRILSNITLLMFLLATIFNVIGNIFLGESLLNATITSVYAGIIYYLCYIIITQLFQLFSYSVAGQKSIIIQRSREKISRGFARIASFVLILVWIRSVIDYFRLSEFYNELKQSIFDYKIHLGDFTINPANLILLFIIILLSFQISKFVRLILEDEVLSRVTLPRGVPGTISMLTRYSILFIGFIVAILAAGIDFDKMAIILGGLGVGIGFGLQNIFSNFVSGLILAFERPIKSDDVIQMDDLLGRVKEIGIRASTVRTFDGAEVIVPNSNLVSNEVINWTLSDNHRRIEVKVGVAYGTDPEKVLDILRKVANENTQIMKDPAPNALFLGFGDSSLDFRMLAWTPNSDEWLKTQSELHVSINNSIKEAGIEIPFPQRDLHLKSVSKGFNLNSGKEE